MDHPYRQSLIQTGLTEQQATVYEFLLKGGALPASKLAVIAGLSRPLTYKILAELEELGYVEKDETPAVARFSAAHPLKLKESADNRLTQAQNAKEALDGLIDKLTSDFNLVSGKPGVRFYEGQDGIRECLNDALTSREEIYSYLDIAAVEREIPDISRDFARARRKRGVRKKNIGVDNPENRAEIEGYYTDITEERLIPWPSESFGTVMQIYDGKVSYMTLTTPLIGIIIADPHIYQLHRSLFETTWDDPRIYKPPTESGATRAV